MKTSGAKSGLTLAQLMAAQGDPKRSMAIATFLVREKLVRTAAVLSQFFPRTPATDMALVELKGDISRLTKPWAGELPALMGVEGRGAEVYFNAWHGMPIQWKGMTRYPIPPDWNWVGHRRSRGNKTKSARHPVQAMLNYGYAVLETQARIEVVKAGLDPMVGFLHRLRIDRLERPGLVLDLLEPMRPEMDRQVLGWVEEERFSGADFTLTRNGTCRLHPQLARRIVASVAHVDGFGHVLQRLVAMLDHQEPQRPPHRSKAWLEEHGWVN